MPTFFRCGHMRVSHGHNFQRQAVACYYRYHNGRDNHPSDHFKVLKALTGSICYSGDTKNPPPPPQHAIDGDGGISEMRGYSHVMPRKWKVVRVDALSTLNKSE